MFTLRKAHEAAFDAACFERFKQSAMKLLRTKFPAYLAPYPDDELYLAVSHGCDCAGRFGLVTEKQITRYLQSALLLEDDLGDATKFPQVRSYLLSSDEHADVRCQRVLEFASANAVIEAP